MRRFNCLRWAKPLPEPPEPRLHSAGDCHVFFDTADARPGLCPACIPLAEAERAEFLEKARQRTEEWLRWSKPGNVATERGSWPEHLTRNQAWTRKHGPHWRWVVIDDPDDDMPKDLADSLNSQLGSLSKWQFTPGTVERERKKNRPVSDHYIFHAAADIFSWLLDGYWLLEDYRHSSREQLNWRIFERYRRQAPHRLGTASRIATTTHEDLWLDSISLIRPDGTLRIPKPGCDGIRLIDTDKHRTQPGRLELVVSCAPLTQGRLSDCSPLLTVTPLNLPRVDSIVESSEELATRLASCNCAKNAKHRGQHASEIAEHRRRRSRTRGCVEITENCPKCGQEWTCGQCNAVDCGDCVDTFDKLLALLTPALIAELRHLRETWKVLNKAKSRSEDSIAVWAKLLLISVVLTELAWLFDNRFRWLSKRNGRQKKTVFGWLWRRVRNGVARQLLPEPADPFIHKVAQRRFKKHQWMRAAGEVNQPHDAHLGKLKAPAVLSDIDAVTRDRDEELVDIEAILERAEKLVRKAGVHKTVEALKMISEGYKSATAAKLARLSPSTLSDHLAKLSRDDAILTIAGRRRVARDDEEAPPGAARYKLCPHCKKASYSRYGVHPQCAVDAAFKPRNGYDGYVNQKIKENSADRVDVSVSDAPEKSNRVKGGIIPKPHFANSRTFTD